MGKNTIFNRKFWTAEAVLASGTASKDFDLETFKPEGFFSLQVTVTGSGTAQITYKVSNDNVSWRTPSGASDIVTAHTVSTGDSGLEFYDLSGTIQFARYLRITVTETSTTDAIAITATLAMQ